MSLIPLLIAVFVLIWPSVAGANACVLPAPRSDLSQHHWRVFCLTGAAGAKVCIVEQAQNLITSDGRETTVRLRFSGRGGQTHMEAVLPLGVDLSKTHRIGIDGAAERPISLNACFDRGCVAFAPLDGPFREALLAGSAVVLRYTAFGEASERSFSFSLAGFGLALARLEAGLEDAVIGKLLVGEANCEGGQIGKEDTEKTQASRPQGVLDGVRSAVATAGNRQGPATEVVEETARAGSVGILASNRRIPVVWIAL